MRCLRTDDEGNDEESDSEEDGHACDDVDEMRNFLSDGSLSCLDAGGKTGNATHDGVVTDVDHHAPSGAWYTNVTVRECSHTLTSL